MRPNTNAESDRGWRHGLGELDECLAELATAMAAGQWEKLPPLIDHLERARQRLSDTTAGTAESRADADGLRQSLLKIGELLTQAKTRQQQIQPLLEAWRGAARDGSTTP